MDQIEQLRRQLEQAQREGNERARFALLGELGNALFARGDFSEASEAYQQAIEIAGQTQDVAGKAATLSNLGNVYTEQGMKKAVALYEEALQLARQIGDRRLEGSTLNNLGLAYDKFGDEEREKGLFERALQIAREVGDQHLERDALNNLDLALEKERKTEEQLTKTVLPPATSAVSVSEQAPRRSARRRLVLLVSAIALILAGGIVWIVSTLGNIPTVWSSVFGAIFSVLGVVVAFLSLVPIVFPEKENAEPSQLRVPEKKTGEH